MGYSPSDIVAYETESRNPAVLLHDSSQRTLCILSHTIRLVQDDDLERWAWEAFLGIGYRQLCKVLDLLPDYGDTSFVGCVELKDSSLDQLWTEQLPRQGQDGGCFACAWWAIEEHMREVVGHEGLFEDSNRVFLRSNIVDGFGTVLFDPWTHGGFLLGELFFLCCLAGVVRFGRLLQKHRARA